MAGIISYTIAMAASLFSPLLRIMRSFLTRTIQNDNPFSSDNSPASEPETAILVNDDPALGSKTPPNCDIATSANDNPALGPKIPPNADILASGPGRTLILFVTANESKLAHVLFVELTRSKFHIVINHFTEDLPLALRRKNACQTQRQLQSLKAAIRENKEFLKDQNFKLLLSSVPLFLHLLNAESGLEFLDDFAFTLGFVRDRSHLPDILSEKNIYTSTP